MTEHITPHSIPGNFRSIEQAVTALQTMAQAEELLRGLKARAEAMVSMLEWNITEVVGERKDALDAINMFAELGAASILECEPSPEAAAVKVVFSAIERDVDAVLETLE